MASLHRSACGAIEDSVQHRRRAQKFVQDSRKNILPWTNTPLSGATTDLIPKPNATTSCNLMQYFLFCKSNCETNKLITSI